MAEGTTGEKSEEPTPQKLKQARKKGQVGKSKDAVSALVFTGAFAVLALGVGTMGSKLIDLIVESIEASSRSNLPNVMMVVIDKAMSTWLAVCLPLLATAMVLALIGNYFQVGFLLTGEPIKPELKKINPIAGLKRLFSVKRLVQVLKQIIQFTLVVLVVWGVIQDSLKTIVLTQRTDLMTSVSVAGELIKDIVIRVIALFLVLGVADFVWQKRVFKKSMMMSKYDVKQEYKQSEGDPHLKGERKRLAQELIMHGSQENTKNADAVITNPVHLAAAIKYDPKKSSAPLLVAKGMRKNAEKIKEIARANQVPILRNVPLAQTLIKLDVDEEIPEELYEAVAEVLNFVYELKRERGV